MGVAFVPSIRLLFLWNIREKMNLKLGQKVIVVEKECVVHLIAEKPMEDLLEECPRIS